MSDTQFAVNYARSTISWKTSADSIGIFKIASVFYDINLSQAIYLSCPVIAGDVYSKGLIPKRPLYHFLWATNGQHATVFRLYSDEKIIEDDINNTGIKSISLKTENITGRKIEIKELLSLEDQCLSHLICRIYCKDFVMEFPIKHINIKPSEQLFQVETGPVLAKIEEKLVPIFVFINSINQIQIVPYFPLLVDQVYIKEMNVEFYLVA
jgi:hypothetical protein